MTYSGTAAPTMWLPRDFTPLPPLYEADPGSPLGEGTFGLVVVGHQTLTGERAAIKCIQTRSEADIGGCRFNFTRIRHAVHPIGAWPQARSTIMGYYGTTLG